jgi:2-polyprenyl-3-methyl-5-hydroxy-6-metoxy-1,4-benzoquinol methylase
MTVTTDAEAHYLSNQIDPILIAASRDFVYPHLRRGRILNVGLGYGTWDSRLATETSSTVVGLDLSAVLVDDLARRYPSIHYVCSDVFDYRPPAPFDTIIASHLLEHMADPQALLRRFASWLAPEGCILIVVPNANSIHRLIGQQMGLLRDVTDLNDGDRMLGHQRVYTAALLREHIESSGLRLELLQGVTFKALSNGQLAQMPRAYVDACASLHQVGDFACQLAAVIRPGGSQGG